MEIVEEPLNSSDKTAKLSVFSPDGKKVAFLEDRAELRVLDAATMLSALCDSRRSFIISFNSITFVLDFGVGIMLL